MGASFFLGRPRPQVAGVDKLAAPVADFQQALARAEVTLALRDATLGPPEIAQHQQTVVQQVLQQPQFLLLLPRTLTAAQQHVVAPDELPHQLLARPTARTHVRLEVQQAQVVTSQCPQTPRTGRVGQDMTEDGLATTGLGLPVDGQEAVEVGLEQGLRLGQRRQRIDVTQRAVVTIHRQTLLQAVVTLQHLLPNRIIRVEHRPNAIPKPAKYLTLSNISHFILYYTILINIMTHFGSNWQTKSSQFRYPTFMQSSSSSKSSALSAIRSPPCSYRIDQLKSYASIRPDFLRSKWQNRLRISSQSYYYRVARATQCVNALKEKFGVGKMCRQRLIYSSIDYGITIFIVCSI